jgi:uncharacterized membrane protein YdjX (TVP38/TMEM64 family)
MLPNWFINISSPIVEIPFSIFFWATLIGISPATFIATNIGVSIADITDETKNIISFNTLLSLSGVAFLSLLPVLFKKLYSDKEKVKDK